MVTASPDFSKPQRTPPYLIPKDPDPFKFQKVDPLPGMVGFRPQSITVDVESEDLGEKLSAVFVEDFQGSATAEGSRLLADFDIAPGHANLPRPVMPSAFVVTFPSITRPGCHSVTLIVTHRFKGRGFEPEDSLDVARATWWYAVDSDKPGAVPCVGLNSNLPDAGGEAGSEVTP